MNGAGNRQDTLVRERRRCVPLCHRCFRSRKGVVTGQALTVPRFDARIAERWCDQDAAIVVIVVTCAVTTGERLGDTEVAGVGMPSYFGGTSLLWWLESGSRAPAVKNCINWSTNCPNRNCRVCLPMHVGG
ncbi:hypothetical protein [Nocardia farcinica]|uniref:hypothetical protein n=1 Tax=Nocardia farcinica TaxID=37329 RepID=UPI0003213057|nr:hypothetical protein [Nocardia farcinica]